MSKTFSLIALFFGLFLFGLAGFSAMTDWQPASDVTAWKLCRAGLSATVLGIVGLTGILSRPRSK
jgi:hypothetical protein